MRLGGRRVEGVTEIFDDFVDSAIKAVLRVEDVRQPPRFVA
jgi:hypothetical protein